MECKKRLIYYFLYTFAFKLKKVGHVIILMCNCTNTIINNNMLPFSTKIKENKNQSTESIEISNVSSLGKSLKEHHFLRVLHMK